MGFEGFTSKKIIVNDASIFVRMRGSGPPLLLLHGFPETHLMWRDVVPFLIHDFTVICADLRGYGDSSCPPSTSDHAPYAKRAMAQDMIEVMEQLGFLHFSIAGHDRGGRVAYRMALDHPDQIDAVAVLDVVPTKVAWDLANASLMQAFWPWSLLAQPEPLPERILETTAGVIIDNALDQWGSTPAAFSHDIRTAYTKALQDPRHAHAICEEYRGAATIDPEHDAADQKNSRRITCPLLALWSKAGALDMWYTKQGGPLKIWRAWADDVQGNVMQGGHFFPEVAPQKTAKALSRFFAVRRR